MKNIKLAFIAILIGFSWQSYGVGLSQEKEDYYTLFSALLRINGDRFTYTDENGVKHNDSLKSFKALEAAYIRAIEPQQDSRHSLEQIKVIMLFAFYGVNRESAAINEYLAADLLTVYSSYS